MNQRCYPLALTSYPERVVIDLSFVADVERGKRNVSVLNAGLMAEGLKVPQDCATLAEGCKDRPPAKDPTSRKGREKWGIPLSYGPSEPFAFLYLGKGSFMLVRA
jgi:hypothetical protein